MDEKTKALFMLRKIKKHLLCNNNLTADDLERFEREEYQAEVRRGMPEAEGMSEIAIIDGIDFIDLP